MHKDDEIFPKGSGDALVDLVNLLQWMREHPHKKHPSDRIILEDGTEIIL